ncbi:MAG: hypothetical protein II942_03235 [Alphaproteobacteria bacterium]|nr:hypothetical protein [Alphaproteobacteria bacterium]
MTIKITVTSPNEDKKALETLFSNIELIMAHKDIILSTPEYYNIHVVGVGVYPLYIPALKLFLGDLIKLWNETPWKQGNNYFYYTIGSPLSGRNSSKSWNSKQGFSTTHLDSIGVLLKPAYLLINTGKTTTSAGCVPVNVPHRTPSNLTIHDLIDKFTTTKLLH